ncbi:MAG: Uma2 family endonuclease [Blautia sp.]|nr:Uma2 family endonuclease [Blautia sp.]
MDFAQKDLYTIADIKALPEGQRAELIDGQMYMMAAPGRIHQEIVGELFGIIREYILRKKGACKPYISPFAVFLYKDEKNYVEPDISVICDTNKLTDEGCCGAPDWIIEVVSPGSLRMDYMIKLFKYENAGVREYWIVDPLKQIVNVYDFAHNDMNSYTFSDEVPSGIYKDLAIDFSQIHL